MTHTSALCFQKENVLLKNIKWGDLYSDITLPLWHFILSSRKESSKVSKHQATYFHVLWKVVQKVQRVWFRKIVALMSKVGIILIWSKLTIAIVNIFILPFLFLFGSVMFVLSLAKFAHILNNTSHDNSK